MKKQILMTFGALLISSVSLNAQAGWWSDTWHDTKEAATSAWGSITEGAKEVKEELKESSEGPVDDLKKLGDKSTYVKAWEGVKESARNPSEPDVDENGIPKQ